MKSSSMCFGGIYYDRFCGMSLLYGQGEPQPLIGILH